MFVSKISGISEEELKTFYKSSCKDPMTFGGDDDLPEEEKPEEMNPADDSNECVKFIQALQTEAEAANMHDLEGDSFEAAVEDPEMENMPDREDMEKLVGKSSKNQIDPNALPSTLRDVMSSSGDFFNLIFRLAVKLRSVPGGADTGFLPNAQNCRRAARGLNWHQRLGCLWICICVFIFGYFWNKKGNEWK